LSNSQVNLPAPDNDLQIFGIRISTRKAWTVAIVAVVVLYLIGTTGKWWPTSDSALYLGLGRSLSAGQGYQFNGEVSADVTPGVPLILAGLRKLFGPGYWAPNIFMSLCGLGALWLIYATLRRMSDKYIAAAVTLCCALSYSFYYNSQRILSDVPFVLGLWATLYCAVRARDGRLWWLIPTAVLSVAAMAIRAPGLAVLAPLAVSWPLDKPAGNRPRRWRRVGIGATMLLAALAAILAAYLLGRWATGQTPLYARSLVWLKTFPMRLITERATEGYIELRYAVAEMFTSQKSFLFVSIPAMALMLVGTVTMWRRGRRFAIITILLSIIIIAVVGSADSIRPRYLLPVQPLMLLLAAEGVVAIVRLVLRRIVPKAQLSQWLRLAALTPLLCTTPLLLLANAPRLMRNAFYYSYLSYTPRYYEVIRGGRHAERFALADYLRRSAGDDKLVAAPYYERCLLHYLSGRRIVEMPTDPAEAFKMVEARRDVRAVVIDMRGSAGEFGRALQQKLNKSTDFEPSKYRGQRYAVFVRKKPASKNASPYKPPPCNASGGWPQLLAKLEFEPGPVTELLERDFHTAAAQQLKLPAVQ